MPKNKLNFSIVLINKDSPKTLKLMLKSISEVEYPKTNFEVIIVDDGSKPTLKECLQKEFSMEEYKWLYIDESEFSSRSKARNLGASVANFDYLIFIDGDQFMTTSTLKLYDRYFHFKRKKELVLGTRYHFHESNLAIVFRYKNQIDKIAKTFTTDERNRLIQIIKKPFSELVGNWHLFWSCNFCITKALFQELGGFDEGFLGWGLEDSEFGYRLKKTKIELDLINNPVWHCHYSNSLNSKNNEKLKQWRLNLAYFYNKHQDMNILEQLIFESSYTDQLEESNLKYNWFDRFIEFESRLNFFTSDS